MNAPPARARLLIARNLRAGERTSGLFWLRAGIVGAMVLALWAGYGARAFSEGPGRVLLRTTIEIDYWVLLIVGISLFPVLIAEERERGTLSLLRLAGFRPLGFLLGQSLSAFVGCLLVLAIQVPFLLLAVALGGTSAQQVGIAVLILLLHAITVYGAALLAGAVSHTSRSAVRLALLLVPLVTFLPRWIDGWLGAAGFPSSLSAPLAPALFSLLFENALSARQLAVGVAAHLAIAAVAALTAWLRFDPRDSGTTMRGVRGPARRGEARPRRPRFPTGAKAFRALATRQAFGGLPMLALLATIHGALVAVTVSLAGPSFLAALSLLLTLQYSLTLLHLAILSTRGSRSIRRERVAALLLLAGGPHLWLSQQRALRLRVLGVHVLAIAVTVTVTSLVLLQAQFNSGAEPLLVPLIWVLCAGFFVDRFGEFCGVAVARGTLAVTVLGGGAIILLTTVVGAWVAASASSVVAFVIVAGGLLVLLAAIASSVTVSRLPKLYAA